MSKSKEYNDRIDDLFSDQEPLQPEPTFGQHITHDEPSFKGGTTTLQTPDDTYIEDSIVNETGTVGWEDYLNAIDRDENFGFSFDQNTIQQTNSNGRNGNSNPGVIEASLQIGDQILGSLQVESGTELSEAEKNILTSIAQQVTQHIENLRLLEQAEQYRFEAEQATWQLTHDGWEAYLQSKSDPKQAFTYDQTRVLKMDPEDSETLTNLASASVVQTRNLEVRDEEIGQIVIADPNCDQTTVDNLMSVIAERLSVHIENLRLLDETEKSRQQLNKRAAELETVAQVSTAAATILEPQAMLQSVVNLTSYSFNLYHVSVYLLNETGDFLKLTAASGKIGDKIQDGVRSVHIYDEKSNIAKAARERETIIISEIHQAPDSHKQQLPPDALSQLSVPLIVGEQLLGVFNVKADTIGRFTKEDTRTFTTLASQTAIALRNAQLYSEQMETVERLRELDHLKSSFLANMSHELRTPLNSILGFTQVILEGLDGPLTEDMEMDLGLIEKNGQHLLKLINEVLDMAKIESGRLSLNLEPLYLPEMLHDVLTTSSPLVRGNVKLINDCQATDNMVIMADNVRLRQILLNLISNALKFTEQGRVKIETEYMVDKVQIRVMDTGIGIPLDKLESIFEAFSQVDSSTTRKVGGTGLGLPISRRLAELHGGWLWAKSSGVSGDGATFYLELPIGNIQS